MITYIIRRMLLMLPTLLGITIMVFLIARLAPGRPGQLAGEGGSMSAEQAKALAEWYEKRYGLDLPLHEQYLRWLKSMFLRDVLADAWFDAGDGTLQPVMTFRRAPSEYFARLDDGSWWLVTGLTVTGAPHAADDPDFLARARASDLENQPQAREGYDTPVHVDADGEWRGIESLDDVAGDLLIRASSLQPVITDARAWFSRQGQGVPLYADREQPGRFLFQSDGSWFAVTPDAPPERWGVLGVDDPKLRTLLGDALSALPKQMSDYVIPRHVVASGAVSPLPADFAPGALPQFTVPVSATAPAGVWSVPPHQGQGQAIMLYQQKDPEPVLLVQSGGVWKRLVSGTRVESPTAAEIADGDPRLAAVRAASPNVGASAEGATSRRQVVLEGVLEQYNLGGVDPLRDLRAYQQPQRIFEVTLGESSQSKLTILQEIKNRLPITLLINVIAFPVIYAVSIPLGMLMAVRRGRAFDTGANIVLLGLWSIPSVLAATLLIIYTARGGLGVEWFPNNGLTTVGSDTWRFWGGTAPDATGQVVYEPGYLPDLLWHLVLPVLCIVYGSFAYLSKQMRASMLDNLSMDYVRTARAKGVANRDIIFRHAFANGLLPLITIVATLLPAMIAGSVIIEQIFNIQGMGLLFFRAVQNRDYDVVQTVTLLSGLLNLTGLLLADICYAVADPRITFK